MSDYKYINSRGESIDLCSRPLWVASFNNLVSYEYEWIQQNGVYFGHARRKGVEKPLTFQYYRAGRESFFNFYERFYRVVNYDVFTDSYGKLYVGDYYGIGNFPKQAVTSRDKVRKYWIAEIPFFMPVEVWYRESPKYTFVGDAADPEDVPAIPLANYPSNYPHGYVSGNLTNEISNDSAFPSQFKLEIFGQCSNPSIVIGGHVYNVNVDVPAGFRLVVDSTTKTIVLYDAVNRAINAYAHQNHDADKYIFEPIPVGDSIPVRYQNIPKVELTLIEERSAPKWI